MVRLDFVFLSEDFISCRKRSERRGEERRDGDARRELTCGKKERRASLFSCETPEKSAGSRHDRHQGFIGAL